MFIEHCSNKNARQTLEAINLSSPISIFEPIPKTYTASSFWWISEITSSSFGFILVKNVLSLFYRTIPFLRNERLKLWVSKFLIINNRASLDRPSVKINNFFSAFGLIFGISSSIIFLSAVTIAVSPSAYFSLANLSAANLPRSKLVSLS